MIYEKLEDNNEYGFEDEHVLNAHQRYKKVWITEQAIAKVEKVIVSGYEELTDCIHDLCKKVLQVSMDSNNSDEVAIVMTVDGKTMEPIFGDVDSVNVLKDTSAYHWISGVHSRASVILIHNHPGLSYFSFEDILFF